MSSGVLRPDQDRWQDEGVCRFPRGAFTLSLFYCITTFVQLARRTGLREWPDIGGVDHVNKMIKLLLEQCAAASANKVAVQQSGRTRQFQMGCSSDICSGFFFNLGFRLDYDEQN